RGRIARASPPGWNRTSAQPLIRRPLSPLSYGRRSAVWLICPSSLPPFLIGSRSVASELPLLQLYRPVRVLEEGLPGLVLLVGELEVEQRTALGLFGLAPQAHVGLLGSAAALLDVALDAGADDVVPGALAALAARDDVVQAQLVGREPAAAVLALVVVAGED